MKNTFTTYTLHSESNANSRLSVRETTLSLQQNNPRQISESLLLSGGFPSLMPGTTCPLSPTLQVNGDLGKLTLSDLELLARAEFERLNRISFRSYSMESDPRICVLARSGEKLKKFVETYGGILDIQPLLLGDEIPGFSRFSGLAIKSDKAFYDLSYTLQTPIEVAQCTYCGLCGSACPVGCLTEDLRIDFSRCTDCRQCEIICPERAIDLTRVEMRHERTPALLLLDGVEVDIPAGGPPVYSMPTLPDFFAALYPSRIDEVISWDAAVCQYSGRLATGCSLCFEACSQGAISRNCEGIEVDPVLCVECGNCVSVCPTGALQYQRFPDQVFVDYCRDMPLQPGATMILGSESTLHTLWWRRYPAAADTLMFLEHPNVRALSLFHFLLLIARGARRIILLDRADEDGIPGSQFGLIDQVNAILAALFDCPDGVQISLLEDLPGHLSSIDNDPLAPPFFFSGFTNRRQGLAAVLGYLMQESGRVLSLPANAGYSFATLSCDTGKCTGCLACLNECRIAALTTDENGMLLQFHEALCVDCGICRSVCPEGALSVNGGAVLGETSFQPVLLARAEPMTCRSCGKVFGTRQSFERVMAILAKRETVNTTHFEYCDLCRVVHLFEAQAYE